LHDRSLRRVSGRLNFYINFYGFTIEFSDKKYTHIIFVSYCSCVPTLNYGQFVVSEQLCAEK